MDTTTAFKELLLLRWKIEPTSCTCGGNYAWLKPRPSGAYEMVGCVCHNNPDKLLLEYEKAVFEMLRREP